MKTRNASALILTRRTSHVGAAIGVLSHRSGQEDAWPGLDGV